MGLFDDLIPDSADNQSAGGGLFDDLIPEAPKARLSDQEVADIKAGGGQVMEARRPSLTDRFMANMRDAFSNTTTGVAVNAAAQGIAPDTSNLPGPTLEDQVRAAQREEADQYKLMPGFETAPTFADSVLEGMAALGGQVVGSVPAVESVAALPIKGLTYVGRGVERLAGPLANRIFQRGTEAAVTNVATDPLIQGGNIGLGIEDKYDPWRTALAGAMGFGFGATPEVIKGVRGWIARRRGVPEAEITPDAVAPEEWQAALRAMGANDRQIAAMDPNFGQTLANNAGTPEGQAAVSDALTAADTFAVARAKQDKGVYQEQPYAREPEKGTKADPALVAAERANPTGRRVVETTERDRGTASQPAVQQGSGQGGALVPTEPQPNRMTPDEITRAQAQNRGGNPNTAEPAARMVAPEGRAPQAPDDIQAQREAGQAFDLAQRQRDRVNPDNRDTQAAGRPEGVNPQEVFLDDGFPVQVFGRRLVPDDRGNMIEVASVQRYDPRTGAPEPDAMSYDVPVRQLRKSNYSTDPRRAQDFNERAQSPRNPEQPRMANEGVAREADQTYRATAPDPNERFPGARGDGMGPEGRSPFPEQPDGPGPWRDRPRTEEDVIRQYEQARARDEARRAAGDGPREEGPRASDAKASNTAKPDNEGRYGVDDRGFVMSDKGGPIRFADQKQGAKWILKTGQKSPDQVFELANHPSGKGFTVRERGRTEPPPKGGGQTNEAPKAQPKQDGPLQLGMREGADQPTVFRAVNDIASGKLKPSVDNVAREYNLSRREAGDLLDEVYRRPDSPIELATGKYDTSENVRYRKKDKAKREDIVDKADRYAQNEYDMKRSDYASDADFIDAFNERRLMQDAEDPFTQAEMAQRAKANNEDVPFDVNDPYAHLSVDELKETRRELIQDRRDSPNEATRERLSKQIGEIEKELFGRPEYADRAADIAARKADAGAGTQLYSGLPLDKMVDEAKKLFGWTTQGAAEWKKSMADFAKEHSEWLKNRSLTKVPGKSLYNAVLGDATAEVRGIANKIENKEARALANDIIDEWFVDAGTTRGKGRTYDESVSSREVSRLNDLGKILGDAMTNETKLNQIVNLVRNPGQIRKGTPMGDAALSLQKFLRDELDYLRASGVEIGDVKNGYYPRAVDEMKVRANPDKFIAAATDAYRRAGLPAKEAKEAAENWRNNILFGDNSNVMSPPGGTIDANFVKGRALPKEADNILKDFLINDPRFALVHYVTRATRRAEFTKRINGDLAWQKANAKLIQEKGSASNARWQEQVAALEKNGAGYAVPHLREYIETMAGIKPSGMGKGANILSWARTWGTLGLLEKATLTSIPEMAMPGIRAGSPAALARGIGYTLLQAFKKDNMTLKAQRELAEDIGMVVAHGNHMLSAARFAGGDVSSKLQQNVLQTYFRNTGLERWTNSTRVAAVGVGQTFIRRLSRELETSPNTSKALLAELGIPKDKADTFGKWVLANKDGMPTVGDLATARDKGMSDMYRTALIRFTDQTIMRPSAATRPRWASHPFGATVFHLMNYTWAFQKNVINRPFKLMTDKDLTISEKARIAAPVLGMMPVLWAMQGIVSEGREALFGDPNRTTPRTSTDKALLWLSRAGLSGKLDPFLNMREGVRYSRDLATTALGPVIGRAFQAAQTVIEYDVHNSERTNAAERKLAKTAYDMGVEPAVNYLLNSFGGGNVAAAIARQYAGSGHAKELFASALANPPEKSNSGRVMGRGGDRGGSRGDARSGR